MNIPDTLWIAPQVGNKFGYDKRMSAVRCCGVGIQSGLNYLIIACVEKNK